MTHDLFSQDAPESKDEEFIPPLSDTILQDLFTAASNILKIQPWKRLVDTDWFALEDPDSGTLQVVAIMGNAGEVFAIHSYLPDEGIRFWNDFMESDGLPNQDILLYDNRMVCCEFVSHDDHSMFPRDEELNQRFGLGCKRGPLEQCAFRSYLPGCFPWHMDEDEARQLLHALRLVPRFTKEHARLPQNCYVPDFGSIYPMIPVYHLPKGATQADSTAWKRRIATFPVAPPKPEPEVLRDDLFLRRVSSLAVRPDTCWELGTFSPGVPLLHEGRPRWQRVSLVAERPGGMVHGTTISAMETSPITSIRRAFADAGKELGYLPSKVCVADDVHAAALTDVALELPIEVCQVAQEEELALFKEASLSLTQQLRGPEGMLPPPPEPELMERLQGFLEGGILSGTGSPEDMAGLKTILDGIGAGELIDKFGQGSPDMPPPGPSTTETSSQPNSPKALYHPPKSRERFVIRVDLKGAKPPIWRRFSLPIDASLFDLHLAIQDTFGWYNCHLHEFQLRENGRPEASFNYGLEDSPSEKSFCEFRNQLCNIYEDGFDVVNYIYDFGDEWEHKVKIEKQIVIDDVQPRAVFLKGRGACPPEDCGGIYAYQALLDGTTEADHLSHEEVNEIRARTFEPELIIPSDIEQALAQLEAMADY